MWRQVTKIGYEASNNSFKYSFRNNEDSWTFFFFSIGHLSIHYDNKLEFQEIYWNIKYDLTIENKNSWDFSVLRPTSSYEYTECRMKALESLLVLVHNWIRYLYSHWLYIQCRAEGELSGTHPIVGVTYILYLLYLRRTFFIPIRILTTVINNNDCNNRPLIPRLIFYLIWSLWVWRNIIIGILCYIIFSIRRNT